MEVMTEKKKGYKRTDVGLIPEDWSLSEMSEVSTLKGRIGWQGLKKEEFTNNPNQPFLITGMNFKDGAIRWDEVYHVPYDRYMIAKEIQLKQGDVLMTKDGTIGKLLFVDDIPSPGLATLNSHLLLFRPINKSYYPKYLYYHLHTPFFKKHIENTKSGTTFFGISQESVSQYKLILPPLEEQQAIATALSDVDELIRTLDGLIQKKQSIKKGTMQQLLTGKKRLPGFYGEWDLKALGESIYIQSGYSFKSVKFKDNGVPIVRISNIREGYIDLSDAVFYSTDEDIPSDFVIEKGEALIAMSGATTGKVGLYRNKKPSYQNQRVGKFVIKNKNKTDSSFILHLVSSDLFKSVLRKELEQGAQPNVSARQIEGLECNFPEDSEEQKAIAQILSDMDRELQTLRQKREKYVQIKQGMMQELLTGRVRLV